MKLYTSHSQLSQPPHFGRVGAQDSKNTRTTGDEARQVIRQSNFARCIKTQKEGLRAVVGE